MDRWVIAADEAAAEKIARERYPGRDFSIEQVAFCSSFHHPPHSYADLLVKEGKKVKVIPVYGSLLLWDIKLDTAVVGYLIRHIHLSDMTAALWTCR